jgi:hypothetical protein
MRTPPRWPRRWVALGAVTSAVLISSACTQPPGATLSAAAMTTIATVGSGADCIPDLSTTHISLAPVREAGATGDVPSNQSADQVRQGAVPAPPNGQLVAMGTLGAPGAGGPAPVPLGTPMIFLYQTSCGPSDVSTFYVAALNQNQWLGSFTPASGASGAASFATKPPPAGTGAATRLFDLTALATGRFVNIHPRGDTTAFITVLAAIEAPGTPAERHPTYVQIIAVQTPSTAGTALLPPSAATTPNVGAAAAPPSTPSAP